MDISIIGIFSNTSILGLCFMVFLSLGIDILYIYSLVKFFPQFVEKASFGSKDNDTKDMFDRLGFFVFPTIILGALTEEVLFRLLPIGLMMTISENILFLYLSVALSSVIFGLLHGGWRNIFIQGFGGLIYSVLFLVLIDGSENTTDLTTPIFVCVVVHSIWNIGFFYLYKFKKISTRTT